MATVAAKDRPMPRKPCVSRFKASLDRKTQDWIERAARPYLGSLLRSAQARMPGRQLTFNDGMGMSTLYIDPERHPYRLGESVEAVAYSISSGSMRGRWRELLKRRDRRYAERFPELVAFMVFVQEIEDAIGQGRIGEMEVSRVGEAEVESRDRNECFET